MRSDEDYPYTTNFEEHLEILRSTKKISGIRKKSREYGKNPESMEKIQIILGVQNPPIFP